MPETLTETPPDQAETTGDRSTFRLAAFGAVLLVTLFAGYGLGRLNNGTTSPPAAGPTTAAAGMAGMPGMTVDESQPHVHNPDGTISQGGATAATMGSVVGGLSTSAAGLTIVAASTRFTAGKAQPLKFRITGPGSAPITTYAIVHDKPLHLIVIRRDLSGYQHLHPVMAPDGTWSIDLTLAAPGSYRAIADFTAIVGGRQLATTLGVDLTVAGGYTPVALPDPVLQVTTAGFTISYAGKLRTESTQPLLMTVTGQDGKAAALEPYLGAYGHLVMVRLGDVGYVHIHPELQLVDGKVKFWLAAPGPGDYRMFFDFQVAGQVHTAAWTVIVQ
jgi:hypothetical protein